ncbi:DinB family protein [Microbacteriaceae bacterium 4G12]
MRTSASRTIPTSTPRPPCPRPCPTSRPPHATLAPPAPLTTIAWRLVHITAGNRIYWEHAFGPGVRTFPDLDVPSTAGAALTDWRASRAPVTRWLATADDTALLQPRPSHMGDPLPAVEVVRILIDEQVHHGAEVALLRDLYLRRDELGAAGAEKDRREQ